jgi:hypothetical protein
MGWAGVRVGTLALALHLVAVSIAAVVQPTGKVQRRHRMPSRPRDARKPGGAIKPKAMADTQ